MNDELQFYPTPSGLAAKAWEKFKNKDYRRVLEPSAGNGDLIRTKMYARYDKVDCCEIDVGKHAKLRELGYNVIGTDFLAIQGGAGYSHIIMNPPFSAGVHHVLKAWDILFSGEIVAIINAETLRNPYSKERRHLADLIEKHGNVEFMQGEFETPETRRKTNVEIALVHLSKTANSAFDVDEILAGMTADKGIEHEHVQACTDLAIPANAIENDVRIFGMAVQALHESVAAQDKALRLKRSVGKTLAQLTNSESNDYDDFDAHRALDKGYDDLKSRAWATLLKSSKVREKLTSKAAKELDSRFEEIKRMDYCLTNIHGFLAGLSQSINGLTIDSLCDIFDEITKYHSDNTVFYQGWKSNDRHRTLGLKIKTTRFVLPYFKWSQWGRQSLDYTAKHKLDDFDRAFAILDGKQQAEVKMSDAMENASSGERVTASYFELRGYSGKQTMHFFPTRKDLVDRLNRIVGAHRAWLPNDDTSPSFWNQYEKAESLDAEFRKINTNVDDLYVGYCRKEYEQTHSENELLTRFESFLSEKGMLPRIERSQPNRLLK